jgi:hypothetical protein
MFASPAMANMQSILVGHLVRNLLVASCPFVGRCPTEVGRCPSSPVMHKNSDVIHAEFDYNIIDCCKVDATIQLLGRWSSDSYARYIRTPRHKLCHISQCLSS